MRGWIATGAAAGVLAAAAWATAGPQDGEPPAVIGRWDLTVGEPGRSHPSWLEIERSGHRTLVGRFVGGGGSARPIGKIVHENGRIQFSIPPQWEDTREDLQFEARLEGGRLEGTVTESGRVTRWVGVRQPPLPSGREEPAWGSPIALFNGRDLSGWRLRHAGGKNGWSVQDGALANRPPRTDLVSEQAFRDFRLRAVLRLPRGSNSGIYLRGRYELQLENTPGGDPLHSRLGCVYGFLAPSFDAARPPEEWQELEATLVGRRLTLRVNGERVIDRQEIPGITGGALDSSEGEPGPIMLQGDHGPVQFREIVVRPAR